MPRTKKQNLEMREAATSKIKSAAMKLFAEKGLASTSVKDIAALAGISQGLLYRYYESKEALFENLVDQAAKGQRRLIDLMRFDANPRDVLRLITEEIHRDIENHGDSLNNLSILYYGMLNSNGSEANDSENVDLDLVNAMTELINKGQRAGVFKEGDPRELSFMFFAEVMGLAALRTAMKTGFTMPSVNSITSILYQ
jgi:AcrR family transcriptional regulator